MAYKWTNTIDSLPFGYDVKVEIIKDTGSADVTTTNGGYIKSLGRIAMGVDSRLGEYKPGDVQFTVRNVGLFWSGTMFAGSWNYIHVRIWVSFDGATWENVFFGQVLPMSIREAWPSSSELYSREYEFMATSSLLSLANVAVDTDLYPWGFSTAANGLYAFKRQADSQWVPDLTYHNNVYPNLWRPSFALFPGIFTGIFSRMSLPADTSAVSLDYSTLQHSYQSEFYNETFNFSQTGLIFLDDDTTIIPGGFSPGQTLLNESAGNATVAAQYPGCGEAKTYYELLKRLCESLNIIPVVRLVDTGTALAPQVDLFHRCLDTPVAITGTLPNPRSVSKEASPFITGYTIATKGLSTQTTATNPHEGQQWNVKSYLMTSPNLGAAIAGAEDYYITSLDDGQTSSPLPMLRQLYGYSGGNIHVVNKAKTLSQFAYTGGGTAMYSFYGIQYSIQLAIETASGYGFYMNTGNPQYKLTYPCVRSTGGTVADLGLMKKITFNGENLMIMQKSIDLASNTMEITAMKTT